MSHPGTWTRDPDPGAGILESGIRDPGFRIQDPGSGIPRVWNWSHTSKNAIVSRALDRSSPSTFRGTTLKSHPASRGPASWIGDPRSGSPDSGSGIPDRGARIPDRGSRLRDPGSRIGNPGSRIRDPGSGIPDLGAQIPDRVSRIRDSGPRIPHPGSRIQDPSTHQPPRVQERRLQIYFASISTPRASQMLSRPQL